MNKLAIVFLLFTAMVCLAPTGSTQTVQAPARPAQSPQPAPTTADVIRVTTELVQTDVAVIDKQGRFVDGLDRDKFELRINGKEQAIAFFEQVTAGSSKEAGLLSSRQGGQQPPAVKETTTSSVESFPRERGRTAFLFVDDLHLSPSSTSRTRDVLSKYVDEVMGTKDQVMIATASGQLGFLQQLTSDRNVLRAAIKRLTHRPSSVADTISSPPMNEYQAAAIENGDRTALSYFVDKQCDEFKRMGRGGCSPDTGLTNNAVYDGSVARSGQGQGGTVSGTSPGPVSTEPGQTTRGRSTSATGNTLRSEAERQVRSRARIIARQAAQVTLNTLTSLESLIRTSSPIRERKLVVFISDGFFLNYLRSTNAYDLRRVSDVALRSGTVIYTIDARGLVTGSIDASTKDGFDTQGRSVRLAMSEVTAAQDPLNALASDTGGRALLNTNDLQKGISQALQETSAYYLLAWRPESTEVAKDRFRRIEVRVKDRPDLTVRVRSGFFAEDPNVSKTANSSGAASGMSIDDQLIGTIRDAYPKAGIPLVLSLGYLDKAQEGLMLAASVQIEREPQAPGEKDAELDVMGAMVDDGGSILSSLKQKVTIPANKAADADKLVLTLQFPKVSPGLRQVRIAARDSRTGRIGSTSQWIEIPDLSQSGLTLSSIFLSEGGASSSSQSASIKPDARFTNRSKLRFQTHVYNAATSGSVSNVVMQVELRHNGQMMTQTPASPVPTAGVKDLARIPVVGEFPLENFPTGQYELKVVVTDQANKKSASQSITFVIE